MARSYASENPVWQWKEIAATLAIAHGEAESVWLGRIAQFRPWREHQDGRRERWSVLDDVRPGRDLNDVLTRYRLRAWLGILTWDRTERRHRVVSPARVMENHLRGRRLDLSLTGALAEFAEALGDLDLAVTVHDRGGSTMLEVPEIVSVLVELRHAVEAQSERLSDEYERLCPRAQSAVDD